MQKINSISVVGFILLNILSEFVFASGDFKIVQTGQGSIKGQKNVTIFDGKPYWSFQGVRYAQSPIGNLRFKAPKPLEPWTGVKDALTYGSECVQEVYFGSGSTGNEDCLFLNIFVPDVPVDKKLPVMIFIHGGAFSTGSGNLYGPDFLLDNNVILVTMNYRLGPLGFMSLGLPEYSGNMGLKDQQLAIKWVYDNIEHFGGDHSTITLFGESAGATSVHYHVLSHKSKSYIERAIIQSASTLSAFAYHSKCDHIKELTEFAKTKGSNTSDRNSLLKYLLEVDAKILTKNTFPVFYDSKNTSKPIDFTWAPVIEAKTAVDPFITDYPINLIQKKDQKCVDILFGSTSNEMYLFLREEIKNPSILESFGQKLELQFPLKHLSYNYDSKEYKKVAEELRQFYFNGASKLGANHLEKYSELLSDTWFVYGVDQSVKYHAQVSSGKIYYYIFSLDTSLNAFKKMVGATAINLPGASHADDLFYIFRVSGTLFGEPFTDLYSKLAPDSEEVKLIKRTTKLWTNFAKYGSPTLPIDFVDFKPVENKVINYVNITNDGLVAGRDPFKKNIELWDKIYSKNKNLFHSNIKNDL